MIGTLLKVSHHILYKLPDNVSFNHAALVEPAAVAFHAVDLTPISLGDTAVVIGTGIIGLFLVQALRIKGCGFVVAVDIDENRLQVAKKLGADLILKADQNFWAKEVLAVTENRGADITFEAVPAIYCDKTNSVTGKLCHLWRVPQCASDDGQRTS